MANKSYIKINNNTSGEIKKGWVKTDNGSKSLAAGWIKTGTNEYKQIFPPEEYYTVTIDCTILDSVTFKTSVYPNTSSTNKVATYRVPASATWGDIAPISYSKANHYISFYTRATTLTSSTTIAAMAEDTSSKDITVTVLADPISVQVTLYIHGAAFSGVNDNYTYTTGGSGDSQYITYYNIPYNVSLSSLLPSSMTKPEYNFEHWSYVDGGAAIANVNSEVGTSDLTVHAVWSVIQVEVCIYENEGTLNGLKTGYNRQYFTNNGDGYWKYIIPCTSKISVVIPSSNPTVPPNHSNGWSPYFWRWGLTRTTLTAIDENETVGYYSYNRVDIYPVFRPRVDVNKDGSTFDFTVTDDYLDNGSYAEYRAIKGDQLSSVLPSSDPIKSGYRFKGWRNAQDSNNMVYGNTIIGWDYMDLYPYFLEIFRVTIGKASYQDNISWYTGGGCYVSSNSMEAYYDCTSDNVFYNISPSRTPSRYGYTFSHWKDSDGNTVVDGASNSSQLTKSTYISPVWTANYWTATMSYHNKLSGTKPTNLYIQKGQTYGTARSSLASSSYTTGLPSLTVDSNHTTGYWPTSGYYFKDSIGNIITGPSTPTADRTVTAQPNIAQHFNYSASIVNGKRRISWGTEIEGQAYYIAFKRYSGTWYISTGTVTSSATYMQFNNSSDDEIILMILDRQPSFSSTSNVLTWDNSGYANGVIVSNGTGTYFKDYGNNNRITFCYSSSSSVLGTARFDGTYCYINFNSNAGSYGHYYSNTNVYVQFSSSVNYLRSILT